MNPDLPAADWYDDPSVPGVQRWFDGTAFTASVRPTPAPGALPVCEGTAQHALLLHTFNGNPPPLPERPDAAPAGWYPSPVGAGWRWFNGEQWTFHTRRNAPRNRRRPPHTGTPRWARRRLGAVSARVPTVLSSRSRTAVAVGVVGMLLAMAALLVAGHIGWNLWGRPAATAATQARLVEDLSRSGDPRFAPGALPASLPKVAVPGTVEKLDQAVAPSAAAQHVTADSSAPPSSVFDDPDNPTLDGDAPGGVLVADETHHPDIVPFPPPGWTAPAGRQPAPMPGDDEVPVGRLRIPAIGVDMVMVTGTGDDALDAGAGVWRDGVMPGSPGNATVAAHRMNDVGFHDLNKLNYGDAIYVDLPGHPTAVYEVRGRAIVTPQNVAVTGDVPGVRLTLLSCHPLNSSRYRLVVQAEMVSGEWVDQSVNRSAWHLKLS